jgi:hypothetical protein
LIGGGFGGFGGFGSFGGFGGGFTGGFTGGFSGGAAAIERNQFFFFAHATAKTTNPQDFLSDVHGP